MEELPRIISRVSAPLSALCYRRESNEVSSCVSQRSGPLKRLRQAAGLGTSSDVITSIRSRNDSLSRLRTGDYAKICLLVCFDGIMEWIDAAFLQPEIPRLRAPNMHRDRHGAVEYIRSWEDDMFQRQFRLERIDFNELLSLISPRLVKRGDGHTQFRIMRKSRASISYGVADVGRCSVS